MPSIGGTWKLARASARDAAGAALPEPYGGEGIGRLTLTAEGRMMSVVCDGRPTLPAGTPREYSSDCGYYTFDGTRLVTRVDAASDPSRIGSDQMRGVRFEDGRMILSPPPRQTGGREEYREVIWERIAEEQQPFTHAVGEPVMIVGTGQYKYRVNADWAKLPEGWSFKEVGGVGVDGADNVYVFNRGEHPMMVFDRAGNFLRSWGEGQYPRAHGVHMAPDDTMFLTDDGGHFVRKVTLDGKVLLELGVPGKPAPYMSGEPFHRCTHTALSPKGEIYVSDGYGNSRVHKYSPDGKLLLSWGEPGTSEGEFNIVHNICTDADGWVYVADRENHRVQVFDGNGRFETQWKNLHRPCGMYMPYGHRPICYIGEVGPAAAVSRNIPNLGPRVSIVDHEGRLIGRFGDTPAGTELGKFLAPHGLAVDRRGDIYVGEVSWTAWPQIYPGKPQPADLRSLQKFERVE